MPLRDAAPVTELTDSRGRTWHIADMAGTSESDCIMPMGSPRATVRRFRFDSPRPWERQTRWYYLRSPRLAEGETPNAAEWATDAETVWRQLRASWSFDDLRTRTHSATAMIQELYSRRGMRLR